jgi:probable selenate reductase FAD-binding subunit
MRNLKEYLRPGSAAEAVSLKQQYGSRAVYLAGGSDLLVHRLPEIETAIDIRHADLGYVLDGGDELVIGGAALLRDAEKAVAGLAGNMLTLAFRDTAPWLIRNAATVAGNIANASPAADSVPALLAVDADLLLLGQREERVPLGDILTGPHRTSLGDRLIREIRVPGSVTRRRGRFTKLARSHSDIAQVNVAVSFIEDGGVLRDVRIALGAVAPTAVRAGSAEALVEGRTAADVDPMKIEQAVQEDIAPISDWRASAEYRSRIAGVLVRRAIQSLFSELETGVTG